MMSSPGSCHVPGGVAEDVPDGTTADPTQVPTANPTANPTATAPTGQPTANPTYREPCHEPISKPHRKPHREPNSEPHRQPDGRGNGYSATNQRSDKHGHRGRYRQAPSAVHRVEGETPEMNKVAKKTPQKMIERSSSSRWFASAIDIGTMQTFELNHVQSGPNQMPHVTWSPVTLVARSANHPVRLAVEKPERVTDRADRSASNRQPMPDARSWSQHRVPRTNQHPLSLGTKYITMRLTRGQGGAEECARNSPQMMSKLPHPALAAGSRPCWAPRRAGRGR